MISFCAKNSPDFLHFNAINYRLCYNHDNGSQPASVKYVKSMMMSDARVEVNCAMFGFVVNDLNSIMRSTNGNGKKKRLVIAHQNLQGGHMETDKKIVDVETIITAIQPDVLGISEVKMHESMLLSCNVDGYNWELKDDSARISVLVNNNLDYIRRKDLERPDVAAVWIEISPKQKKSLLICQAYREWRLLKPYPDWKNEIPGSGSKEENEKRWNSFLEVLKQVADSKQEFHLCGDINLNYERWQQVALDRLDEEDEG